MKGKVKIHNMGQSMSTRMYRVILTGGTEEDLLDRLNGDLSNLVTVCDNRSFDDLDKIGHYGGRVKPSLDSEGRKCYDVDVYID